MERCDGGSGFAQPLSPGLMLNTSAEALKFVSRHQFCSGEVIQQDTSAYEHVIPLVAEKQSSCRFAREHRAAEHDGRSEVWRAQPSRTMEKRAPSNKEMQLTSGGLGARFARALH